MAIFTPVTELGRSAQASWDATTESIRKRQAYNALRQTYGPIAGDPVSALQLQKYGFNEQANPLLLTNQQLQNEGLENRNNFLAQDYPLLLENQTNANEGQRLGNSLKGEQVTAAQDVNAQSKAQHLRGVLGGALSSLGSQLQGVQDPTQRGAIFDQTIGQIAPMLGVDPEQVKAQLARERAAVISGGADAIPQLQSDLQNAIYAGLSPKDRAALIKAQADAAVSQGKIGLTAAQTEKARADTEKARAQGEAARVKAQSAKFGKPGDIQKNIAASQFLNDRVGTVIGTVRQGPNGQVQYGTDGLLGRAYQLLNELPKDGAALWASSFIPGSKAYQLNAIFEQLEGSLSVDDLRAMKQSGLSLGRVTVAEFQAVSKAIANLDLKQGADVIRQQLGTVGKMYQDLHEANDANIQTLQGQLDTLQGNAPEGGGAGGGAAGGGAAPRQQSAPPPAPQSGAPAVPATTNAITTGQAIPANQSISPYQLAKKWVGSGERSSSAALTSFFKKSGGTSIDPAQTPWCAAFANAVLGATGNGGTGSLAARSFLKYGTPTDNPSQGDVVVLSRGNNPAQGHVGFYAGTTTKNGVKYVKILGGNQGNKVSVAEFPASRVIGYRKPPSAGEIKTAVASAAQQAPAPQQAPAAAPAQSSATADQIATLTAALGGTQPESALAQAIVNQQQGQPPSPLAQAVGNGAPATPEQLAAVTPEQALNTDNAPVFTPQQVAEVAAASAPTAPPKVQTLDQAQAILKAMGLI